MIAEEGSWTVTGLSSSGFGAAPSAMAATSASEGVS